MHCEVSMPEFRSEEVYSYFSSISGAEGRKKVCGGGSLSDAAWCFVAADEIENTGSMYTLAKL